MSNAPGIFITVEGTDGSGKTTQIRLIESFLKDKGCETVCLREPGGTAIGEMVRAIILDPKNKEMANSTELLLYAAARAQLVEEIIKPSLKAGKTVICDRFIHSTSVYQGYARGMNLNIIDAVNDIAIGGISPSITFFLDLNPAVAMKRRLESSALDRIEKEDMDFHTRVYNGYKELVLKFPDLIKRIDASRSEKQVFSQIKECLEN